MHARLIFNSRFGFRLIDRLHGYEVKASDRSRLRLLCIFVFLNTETTTCELLGLFISLEEMILDANKVLDCGKPQSIEQSHEKSAVFLLSSSGRTSCVVRQMEYGGWWFRHRGGRSAGCANACAISMTGGVLFSTGIQMMGRRCVREMKRQVNKEAKRGGGRCDEGS